MAEVVENLLSKHKVSSSSPVLSKKKEIEIFGLGTGRPSYSGG
jgi:hypothetical protein